MQNSETSGAAPRGGNDDPTQPVGPLAPNSVELARVLDQVMADLQDGKPVERAQLLAAHPEIASQLEPALNGLEFIYRLTADTSDAPTHLGDFRIVREVGRGGMGVVYEAEQISLRRRVALKVLRLGAVADEVAMQRFQREAETVAGLHHTNIVPIFAVGSEQGVRYYAMQYIEGRNLASLLSAETKAHTFADVAQWGLQGAEALAHAHQRGVIHRDIKPSNLILDNDGRIWLTDFGLARRDQDITLSLTGALLGTPCYMSPEQASAATKPVDHRTDIYSLGATLYELATGRPIFDAASPHEVIHRILSEEPVAPRSLASSLPRDLETIILKCLTKEPNGRYPTAQALADDLRAFLDNRAITARRPNLAERAVRWTRKHRRTSTVAALSAGICLLVLGGGFLAWQAREQGRMGRLELTSDTPNLLAEVVDEQDQPVVPLFPVPTAKPISLPAGSHKLRLSASGVMSETWPLEIPRRENVALQVQLRPRWLWPPKEVNTAEYPETEVVSLGVSASLFVLTSYTADSNGARLERRLRRLDGATGNLVWDLVFDTKSLPPGGDVNEWQNLLQWGGISSSFRNTGLAERACDLDGDGTNDLVLISLQSPSLLAVSGATGRPLWWSRGRPTLPADLPTDNLKLDHSRPGFIVGRPAVADVNGDGIADFIACFRSEGDTYVATNAVRIRTGPQCWVGAISGKTGSVLWQRMVADRWEQYRNSSDAAEKFGALCRPGIGQVQGRRVVVLAHDAHLLGFDARTGEPAWAPVALGFEPLRAPDLNDLDGDGESEALFLRSEKLSDPLPWARHLEVELSLMAVSLPAAKPLWQRPLMTVPMYALNQLREQSLQSYRLASLDDDQQQEILVTQYKWLKNGGQRMTLSLLDNRTGSNRWERLLWSSPYWGTPHGLDQCVAGPDLDGDGTRELLAAWNGYDDRPGKPGLMVAALSGKSGRMLWRWFQPYAGEASSMRWWHAGADGWPLLLVGVKQALGRQGMTYLLSSGTGRLENILPDVSESSPADFDGDGIADLFYSVSPQGAPRYLVIKGSTPEPWRQLRDWRVVGDFDGDGDTDLVSAADRNLSARSGRDARILWQAELAPDDTRIESPIPVGDLDGDRVPDLLAQVSTWRKTGAQARQSFQAVAAFSGKDGHRFWLSTNLDLFRSGSSGGGPKWYYNYPLVDSCNLNNDGRSEILAINIGQDNRPWLMRISGINGQVAWKLPITLGGFALSPSPSGKPLADFNRDGTLDFALWSPAGIGKGGKPEYRLNVFDGRSGKPLWERPSVAVDDPWQLAWPEPTVGELDGDGLPEVVVTRHGGYNQRLAGGGYQNQVVVVDGRDGQIRWTWEWSSGFPDLCPPILLKTGSGGQALLCLATVDSNGRTDLVALDALGQVRHRRKLNFTSQLPDSARFLWRAADVDGDDRQELVYQDGNDLCVAGGENLEVRWRWKLPDAMACVTEVRPANLRQGPELTVWAGREAFGLDGVTGLPRWRCQVPEMPRWGGSDLPVLRRLESASFGGLPRLQGLRSGYNGTGGPAVVRQAWPTTDTGTYRPLVPTRPKFASFASVDLPKRPLPWNPMMTGPAIQTIGSFTGLATLFLVVLPGLLMRWAVRRQSVVLGFLPVAYGGLGLVLMPPQAVTGLVALAASGWMLYRAVRANRATVERFYASTLLALVCLALSLALVWLGLKWAGSRAQWAYWERETGLLLPLMLALVGTPGLMFWLCGVRACQAGRWTRLAWLLGGSVALALGAGLMMIWRDGSLEADETYSWRGWYSIWFLGAYLAGLLCILFAIGRKIRDWVKRRRAIVKAA